MNARTGRESAPPTDWRSERDFELDLEVGLGIEGYRWFEWNHKALGGAPLYEPGRFVAHPADLVSHLYIEAGRDTPLAALPYRRLPRYSSDIGPALRAAVCAGLFSGVGTLISCSPAGVWRAAVTRGGIEMEDDCLPRLISRAALRLLSLRPPESGAR